MPNLYDVFLTKTKVVTLSSFLKVDILQMDLNIIHFEKNRMVTAMVLGKKHLKICVFYGRTISLQFFNIAHRISVKLNICRFCYLKTEKY